MFFDTMQRSKKTKLDFLAAFRKDIRYAITNKSPATLIAKQILGKTVNVKQFRNGNYNTPIQVYDPSKSLGFIADAEGEEVKDDISMISVTSKTTVKSNVTMASQKPTESRFDVLSPFQQMMADIEAEFQSLPKDQQTPEKRVEIYKKHRDQRDLNPPADVEGVIDQAIADGNDAVNIATIS